LKSKTFHIKIIMLNGKVALVRDGELRKMRGKNELARPLESL
jgi:hypothetical protein